jgi:hypothetical protein
MAIADDIINWLARRASAERYPVKQAAFVEACNAARQISEARSEKLYTIEHDGFEGVEIGSYLTLEGKRGLVLQQRGTRVVHVYGERFIK